MVLSAVNRRGRPIQVRVAGSPLDSADGKASGAILLMEQDSNPIAEKAEPELAGQHDGKPPSAAADTDHTTNPS